LRPFSGGASRHGKGTNGQKSGFRVDAGGHNNIKPNPVFRGMVRQKTGGLLTKGKL
jgi:hypothetical protein